MLSERAGKRKKEIRHLIKEFKAKIYIFRKKYPLS
jgi:hypothetical protein